MGGQDLVTGLQMSTLMLMRLENMTEEIKLFKSLLKIVYGHRNIEDYENEN